MAGDPKRVFISYTHDSSEHKERARALADRLRDDGLDAAIDQYVNGTPSEGWPLWMQHCIEGADAVLVVCTEKYKKRYLGEEQSGVGLGAVWEAVLARGELYGLQGNNTKFVPVVFDQTAIQYVPAPLNQYTWYVLMEDYERLLRYLTNQPSIVAPPIGPERKLPPDP
ncbi:MAG: SEFIR domain-containing protein [Candidatus Brocadiia bacterium]